MATAVTPAAIEGFLAGLRAGQTMRNEREASERADLALGAQMENAALARRRHEVDLAAAVDRQQRQALGRSVVPKILGAEPTTVETAPAVPAVPAVPMQPATAVMADDDPFAGASVSTATPGVPARPARPATTVSAHTLPGLAQAAGGEVNLAAALETPEGQRAVAMLKPVSAQEFEQQQRKSKAREEFTRVNDEAREALEAGDAMKAAGLRVRAMRAALEGGADSVAAAKALQDAEKWYFDLRREPEERKKADAELQPFMAALRAYRERPDHDTETGVIEAAASVQHKLALPVVKEALNAFEKTAGRNAKAGYVHRDIAALNAATTRRWNEAVANGAPFSRETWVAARQQAAREHPAGAAMLFDVALRDPKAHELSALDKEALLGDIAAPKDIQQEAIRNVRAKLPAAVPGSAAFVEAVSQEATRLTLARRPPRTSTSPTEDDRTERKLLQEIGQIERRINGLNTRLQDKKDTGARDELANLQKERRALKQKLGALRGDEPETPDPNAPPAPAAPTTTPPAAATPKPSAAAATLTPEQRSRVRATLADTMKRLFPGRDPRSLTDAEKRRVETEVNRALGAQ